MKNISYPDLCARCVTGNLSNDDEVLLNKWLSESEKNRSEFEKIKTLWNKSDQPISFENPDIDSEWQKLDRRISSERLVKPDEHSIISKLKEGLFFLFAPKIKPISAIVLILFAIILSTVLFKNEPVQPQLISVTTTAKEIRKIQLADGSEVILNGNSRLEYQNIFNSTNRDVKLSGEAFFSVRKDTRPFIIRTLNAQTTVLGTKFNVWARDERTRVTVKEGKVKVSLLQKKDDVVFLTHNQQITISEDSQPAQPRIVDSDFLLEWLNNKLVFNETPLIEVTAEIERYFGAKILLDKNQGSKYLLTGSFNNSNADSVISMVCLALDLDYEKLNDGYLIKSKK